MTTREFWQLSSVSDENLLQELSGLLAAGARAEARLVAHLAEVEERRLHLKAATSSLFDYCLRRIGLSESEAFHRITAARLARRFPVIFGLLESRTIHLSALRVLRDHLTSENHRGLLAAASGKTTKEVQVLVAAFAPRPDVASLIRKLPAPRCRALPLVGAAPATEPVATAPIATEPVATEPVATEPVATEPVATEPVATEPVATEPIAAARLAAADTGALARDVEPETALGAPVSRGCEPSAGSVQAPSCAATGERVDRRRPPVRRSNEAQRLEPLSATRYLLRLSIGQEMKDKLDRARDLISHAVPSGELEAVLERALDLLLEKLEKQRFAQTQRPRRTGKVQRKARADGGERAKNSRSVGSAEMQPPPRVSRKQKDGEGAAAPARREHIANEIRRAVAMRDEGQCTYVDAEGRRCGCRAFLQLHHEQAHALGGLPTLQNLRLLCGPHNRLLAEQDFGRAHQARFTERQAGRDV